MPTLSLSSMEKLLKEAGAHRVSEDAKEALREVLESHAKLLGERSAQFAEHANRKTVKGSDIRLAERTTT